MKLATIAGNAFIYRKVFIQNTEGKECDPKYKKKEIEALMCPVLVKFFKKGSREEKK
jgi:hypothetical protein